MHGEAAKGTRVRPQLGDIGFLEVDIKGTPGVLENILVGTAGGMHREGRRQVDTKADPLVGRRLVGRHLAGASSQRADVGLEEGTGRGQTKKRLHHPLVDTEAWVGALAAQGWLLVGSQEPLAGA